MVKKTIEKNEKDLDNFHDEKHEELGFSKDLQKNRNNDLLVSHDFTSLHPSAQIDLNSTWPKIKTAYPF